MKCGRDCINPSYCNSTDQCYYEMKNKPTKIEWNYTDPLACEPANPYKRVEGYRIDRREW